MSSGKNKPTLEDYKNCLTNMHPILSGFLVAFPLLIIAYILNQYGLLNLIVEIILLVFGLVAGILVSRHFSKKYYSDNDVINKDDKKE